MLTKKKRKLYFSQLGLGEYNAKNILKLQKKYFPKYSVNNGKKECNWNGVYGKRTNELLRHCHNVAKYTRNFAPEKFKCECGGKYCNGYPVRMKAVELKLLQEIRDKYNQPITITSGIRCKKYNNRLKGAVAKSPHTTGYAVDIVFEKTKTKKGRKAVVNFAKTLQNLKYAYCNGYASNGTTPNSPNMGTAVHIESKKI